MKSTQRRRTVHPICWILVVVCLLAGIAGVITVSILYSEKSKLPYNYGIGIDAGSSRTDIYVYRWPTDKENGTGIAEQIHRCPSGSDKQPSLSSFAANPSEAGIKAIKPCMDKILGVVPSTDYSSTPVLLGATAGMRTLNVTNSSAAEAIMSSVRKTLSSYPFDFSQPLKQARIIAGSEEGAFGWVTSNYLSGSLGVRPSLVSSAGKVLGALDMGGASTQMTFDPGQLTIDRSYEARLRLYGYTYSIYTHSYLCYGLDEGHRQYRALLVQMQNFSRNIDDPCAPRGNETQLSFSSLFKEPCTSPAAMLPAHLQAGALRDFVFLFRGTSDPATCHNLTRLIFSFSAPCPLPPCTFNGVYQPPLTGQFLAFSGFFYVARDLGLNPAKNSFSLEDYRRAMNNFCNLTWDQISGRWTSGSFRVLLCFQAQHVYHLLVDGYGFNDTNWNSIKFVSKINDNDLGWVLGMMINTTNIIPSHDYVTKVSVDLFTAIVVISSVLFLASLVIAIAVLLFKRSGR